MEEYRRCSKCKQEFPATAEWFYRNKSTGLDKQCKACRKVNQHRYTETHKDRVKASKKAWFDKNPEYKHHHYEQHREQYGAANKMRYRRHKAESALYHKKRYQDNRDVFRERSRESYIRRRDKGTIQLNQKIAVERRRAKKLETVVDFTKDDWLFALDYWRNRCAICGRTIGFWHTLALDHWIPVCDGGNTVPGNIVPLCHGIDGCNNSKGKKNAMGWLVEEYGKRVALKKQSSILEFFSHVRSVEINGVAPR